MPARPGANNGLVDLSQLKADGRRAGIPALKAVLARLPDKVTLAEARALVPVIEALAEGP